MEEILDFANRNQLYNFLIKYFGFVKIEEKYDSACFGNFFITLSSDIFLLRYVNDRSFFTIEIASLANPRKWYDLSFIRDYIDNPGNMNADQSDLTNPLRIRNLNAFLRKDFDLIGDLLNKDNYKDTQREIDMLLKQVFDRRSK